MLRKSYRLFCALAISFITMCYATAYAGTLETVKKRGKLNCGIDTGIIGFAYLGKEGKWVGFDVDLCKSIAVAIFNNAEAVNFLPLTTKERFTALQSGEIDVLIRSTTWNFTRDVLLGLDFAAISYYDGQAFMVPKSLGVKSTLELDGARICMQTGTTTELNASDYFSANNMKYTSIVVDTVELARHSYKRQVCDVMTADSTNLMTSRRLFKDPDSHIVLPERISKEPLAITIRHGDNKWGDLVRWTFFTLVSAEELGVTKQNVTSLLNTSSLKIKRLIGIEGGFGENLNISNKFGYNIIRTIGNYGEVFDRNLGKNSLLKVKRKENALWTDGGLMYSPPIR